MYLIGAHDPSRRLVYNVTSITSYTGYVKVNVTNVSSSATAPFNTLTHQRHVFITIVKAGQKGQKGQKGELGNKGQQGQKGQKGQFGQNGTSFLYQFDTSTTMSDPGNGDIRFNNSTLSSVTQIAIDDYSYPLYTNMQDFNKTLDDVNNVTNTGFIRVTRIDDRTKWVLYSIEKGTYMNGWAKLDVTCLLYTSPSPRD